MTTTMQQQSNPNRDRHHHPYTGKWDAVPAGVPMISYEIASYVGITTQAVCNRFSQEPYPEGFIVRKTKNRATIYIRMDAVTPLQVTGTEGE